MMTPRERILSVYRNDLPDRVPVGIYPRYLQTGAAERRARSRGLGIIAAYPPVSLLAPPWHTHSGFVSRVENADLRVGIAWEGGERVESRTYETPVGVVTQRIVKDPQYGSDWVKKHYVEKREDYGTLQYIVENTVFSRQEDAFTGHRETLGEDGVLLGRVDRCPFQKMLIELAGPERFLVDLLTDPEPPLELMEAMRRRLAEQFDMAVASAAEAVWQPDNLTSDLTPPDLFTRHVLPYYAGRGALCREAGKPYVVHMDGKLKALGAQIAESPFDVVESFSLPAMSGDLTIGEAAGMWPAKVLCPNFPTTLCHAGDAAARTALEEIWRSFGGDTPFMLQASEDFPLASHERVLVMLCDFSERHPYG